MHLQIVRVLRLELEPVALRLRLDAFVAGLDQGVVIDLLIGEYAVDHLRVDRAKGIVALGHDLE